MDNDDGKVRVADEIRRYCRDNYVLPSKKNTQLVVAIKSGEVHEQLSFKNRLPAICSVLGSRSFEEDNNIIRIAIDGPLNGASTIFVYKLL